MADEAKKPKGDRSSPSPGKEAVANDAAGSLMCLLWRCVACGAAVLGTIQEKPGVCQSCGGRDFEFVEED